MLLSAVVFFTTGAVLCCFPACSSDVTCNYFTPYKSVYAFPSNIWTEWNSTKLAYFLSFNVTLHPKRETLDAAGRVWKIEVAVIVHGEQIDLDDCATEKASEPDKIPNQQKNNYLTVDTKCIFARSTVKEFGKAKFLFVLYLDRGFFLEIVKYCETYVDLVQDNAPSVLFKTALKVSPGIKINSSSKYVNETLDIVVELKINNIDNAIEVHLQVNDSDYFVENANKSEFCAVSEPNITLSAVLTFTNFSQMSNFSSPYNLTLATDDGLNQNEGAWWKKNSSRVNETLINVRLDFAVSALCAAISDQVSSSGHLSLDSYSVAYVNITLNVTATSGITYPQLSTGKLTLVLVFKGECFIIGATAKRHTVTTANEEIGSDQDLIHVMTAHIGAVTTANEETGTEQNLIPVTTSKSDTVPSANEGTNTEQNLFPGMTSKSDTTVKVTTANERTSTEQNLFPVMTAHSDTVTTANEETNTHVTFVQEQNLFPGVMTAQSNTVTTANEGTNTEKDLFPVMTAYSDTVTTANEETGPTNFNVLVVVIGVTLSVILMFVLIALAVKYRTHLLRLYNKCKTALGRLYLRICLSASSLQADRDGKTVVPS